MGLNVVITGGSKGLGKALTREFLLSGDNVIVTSRSKRRILSTVRELRRGFPNSQGPILEGLECEVSDYNSVNELSKNAKQTFGSIDVWINNAGSSGGFQNLQDMNSETVHDVISTNLTGSLLCTKSAIEIMKDNGGHIFTMEGAGSNGLSTPGFCAYGASKIAITHFTNSLRDEIRDQPIGLHTISPGMMLTDLLIKGTTIQHKQFFNILCERPETVANFLIPKIKYIVKNGKKNENIKYLTILRLLEKFVRAPMSINRFFDSDGNALF